MTTALTGLGAAACGRSRDYVVGATSAPTSSTSQIPVPVAYRTPASGHAAPAASSCSPTEDNIEGPFFKPGAPSRAVLADASTPGEKLTLSGRVLSRKCAPIAGAKIEIWHADHEGAYDNGGFSFRARLACDDHGAFALETIIPGRYLNGERYRPAHLHLKVAAQGHRPLTTQLYFEGDPYNEGDPFIRESLIMTLGASPWGKAATYDIVLG